MTTQKLSLIVVLTTLLMALVPDKSNHAQTGLNFPNLSGPYQVGKANYDLVDKSRTDVLSDNPQAAREILITTYYPAQPTSGTNAAPYAEGKLLSTISDSEHVPVQMLQLIHPHAFVDAPLATPPVPYPIVIFSPGWGTPTIFYTEMLENLASQGYVVAAIWHTDSSEFVVFPDGRIVRATKAGTDPDKYTDKLEEALPIRKKVGDVWIGDIRFVLDQLSQFNKADPRFAGHLDLTRVGVFGHSFGGAVAVQTASLDIRFLAAINIDGSPIAEDKDKVTVGKPFMLMRSDNPRPTDVELAQSNLTRQQFEQEVAKEDMQFRALYVDPKPGYYVTLKGSAHLTYSDYALVAPISAGAISQDIVGTIDGTHALQITNRYIEAFFNKHLKGLSEPILNAANSPYPDVVFDRTR